MQSVNFFLVVFYVVCFYSQGKSNCAFVTKVVDDLVLVKDDLVEVGLVVVLVLAIVDGAELQDAVPPGGSSGDRSLGARGGGSTGVSASTGHGLLGVGRRGRGGEGEEPRVRNRGEGEESLRVVGRRHCGCGEGEGGGGRRVVWTEWLRFWRCVDLSS